MSAPVLFQSQYVPPEWIAAHGLVPRRVLPGRHASSHYDAAGEGVCPCAQALFETALNTPARAVVFATTCDQMRRQAERAEHYLDAPMFLLNIPSTWQTPASRRLYAEELKRLSRFLLRLGGRAPENGLLLETLRRFDEARARLRGMIGLYGGRAWAEMAGTWSVPEDVPPLPSSPPVSGGVPVAVLGAALLSCDLYWLDLIEASGGRIVLDGTGAGERMLPAAFDRRSLADDPLGELTRVYFDCRPDIRARPNNACFAWLKKELSARGVRGLVLHRYIWCDHWLAEVPRLRALAESLGVRFLDFDNAGEDDQAGRARLATRIEAFLESLRQ